tara:strand:+ start:276 stop:1520 length:1245 start_codon:yes stop_codon:yes gene_type:complete
MSDRYPGGLIRKTPPTVTPPVNGEGGSAPGIWTLEQASYYQGIGEWPKPTLPRELYTWGSGSNGQLGLGFAESVNVSSPTQVGSLISWSKVSGAGRNAFSFAIKPDNTLWTWGLNTSGQLGTNDLLSRSSPVQIGALTNWAEVSTNTLTSLAVKTDGTLWAWGLNNNGAVGNNNLSNPYAEVSSPIQIGANTNWYKVAAGDGFSLALKTDGTMWSWGKNDSLTGKLGQNDIIYRSSPTQIGSLTTWAVIAAGERVGLAVKTDGTIWTWGNQNFGRLGNNVSANAGVSSPIQIGALTNWSTPNLGSEGSFAIKTDGTLWGWSSGGNGRLGTGDTISRSSPVQIGSDTNWSKIASGPQFAIATKTDKTLWTWGIGTSGQLGHNAAVSLSSPVQVGAETIWNEVTTTSTSSTATTIG